MKKVKLVEERVGDAHFLRWPIQRVNLVHLVEPQVFQRDPGVVNYVALGITGKRPVMLQQVHGDQVLDASSVGPSFSRKGDGLFTSQHELLGVLTADCLPLLLVDPTKVVLLHVGWRGMVAGIVERGVGIFEDTGEVSAMLGPCIRGCCYQVDAAFQESVREAYPLMEDTWYLRDGRLWFDIPTAVEEILFDSGVRDVMDCGLCTCCHHRFPSYRREGERAGRMLTLAWR